MVLAIGGGQESEYSCLVEACDEREAMRTIFAYTKRPSISVDQRRIRFSLLLRGILTLVGAVCLLSFVFEAPASAEIYQIAGASFTQRCPCPGDQFDDADENNGVLIPNNSQMRFIAPVDLPNGQRICSFSLVYNDINANDAIVARLKRRAFTVNGAPFATPAILAVVSSAAGTPNTVRKATDTTIVTPIVNEASAFYYVELTIPTVNLNILGVQIDVRPTCP